MKDIIIQYDTYYDKWISIIRSALEERNINHDDKMIQFIFDSLKNKVEEFLKEKGYEPTKLFLWRKDFVKKLKSYGMKLDIKSNDILWKYLEYFTDVEDYSKCFDVKIIISDWNKASKYITVEDVKNKKAYYETDIQGFSYENYASNLLKLKQYENKYAFMPFLINIIEEIWRLTDYNEKK